MSKLKLVVLLAGFTLLFHAGTNQASPVQDLPNGTGIELVRERCLLCHEADLIVQQRLSRAGWVREVEKMIRWGTVATDAEKEVIVNYLARALPPARGSSESPTLAQGKIVFEEKCLLCHEADLTEQQRLSRAGWTREVDKMIRWGAQVTDAEKGPLIDFLSDKYKP